VSNVCFLSLVVCVCGFNFAQIPLHRSSPVGDEVQKIQEALRKHPPPAFREILAKRHAARLALQRRGYAEMLYENMHRDPLNALIACLKMKVQMDFSLSQGFLFWIVPPDPTVNRPGIPFEENQAFPIDPWDER